MARPSLQTILLTIGLLVVPGAATLGAAGPLPDPLPEPLESGVMELQDGACVDDKTLPGWMVYEYPCPQYEGATPWGCPYVLTPQPLNACEPGWYYFDFPGPDERESDFFTITAFERGVHDDVDPFGQYPVMSIWGGRECFGPQSPLTLHPRSVTVCDDTWVRVVAGTTGWLRADYEFLE